MSPLPCRRRVLALLAGLGTLLAVQSASGAENDFKVIDGILVQPLVLPGDRVAQLSGPEGAIYYIDLRHVAVRLPPDPLRIDARTVITVAGYEGPRPDQISAHALEIREAAPPPPEPRQSVDLRVFEGVVQSVTRRVLSLRTADGRTLAVRIGSLVTSRYPFFRGDRLKVIGVVNGDDTFAANAVVHQAQAPAAPVDPAGYGP